jgi:hypothetical protein
VVSAQALHLAPVVGAMVGGVLCFALRFGAIRHGWRLPTAQPPQPQSEGNKR